MSFTMWVARELFPRKNKKPFGDYHFFLREDRIHKLCFNDGTVDFYGAEFTICEKEGWRILKKEGLMLDPGDGPVKIEVAIRRVE